MGSDTTPSWSDGILMAIERYFEEVKFTCPHLEQRVDVKLAHKTRKGADVRLTLRNFNEREHTLLVEVEQYASGKGFTEKIKRWASRHFESEETTTVVIALVAVALRNRLIGIAKENRQVNEMVFSRSFRIFGGIGDGTLGQAFREFVLRWIEAKSEAFS